ncbi:hypothetical protein SCHPADRAFT_871507 [Schizopora paradoxa]|uniref:Integral membrane protein n=1 Tax=Schizopora paradoxa TaxID=27342 RepID=A0A0H2S0B8_9AGAM|nr:hypothetical protein SCHPADRAFT_871507 [Schizopora paradoxa]
MAEAEASDDNPNANRALSATQADDDLTGGEHSTNGNGSTQTKHHHRTAEERFEDFYQRTAFSRRPHLFKPTHARVPIALQKEGGPAAVGVGRDGLWRSRDHRKGRHRLPQDLMLRQKIARLFKPELMNLAWWIAFSFTIGSVVWCINGFYVFLPFIREQLVPNETAIGWTGWLGATIFFFAAWPEVWEALIREDAPHYTWDTASASSGSTNGDSLSRGSSTVVTSSDVDKEKGYKNSDGSEQLVKESRSSGRGSRFLGLNLSRFRELGFIGSFIQAWAATIFWISGFTGLPQVQNSIMNDTPLLNGVFWTPQVIGGSGFIISAGIFMLEAQHRWWKPNVTDIGWHVGFWNLIGGLGFTLCAVFGYSSRHWRLYQSALSTFWGSWAFLIGSLMQWWESVNPR